MIVTSMFLDNDSTSNKY